MTKDTVKDSESSSKKSVCFPSMLHESDLNNFVTSLITYDRICFDGYSFIKQVLSRTPKKYHNLLVDFPNIELWSLSLNIMPIDELLGHSVKPYFTQIFNYTEKEFNTLTYKLDNKIKRYKRNAGETGHFFENEGNALISYSHDFLNIFDAIHHFECNYYSASNDNKELLQTSVGLKFDNNEKNKIFEINRFPDICGSFQEGNFDLEKFISLKDKEGYSILREIMFKENNFDNSTELLREYQDILLRDGIYKDNGKNTFWALSNGLSLAGIFSGNFFLTIGITLGSVLTGNYKFIIKNPSDKVEKFLRNDLKKFIKTIK